MYCGHLSLNFFYIKDLLRKLRNESTIPMTLHADLSVQELSKHPVWQIHSQNDILSYISVLFAYAREEGEEGLIYYFLPEEFMFPENIYFYWQGEKKMVEVHQVTPHGICQVVVKEPGVYQAFRSFYEYLEQKHMLTPKDEVIGFLEQVKEEYR